jgi:hypothetical protein
MAARTHGVFSLTASIEPGKHARVLRTRQIVPTLFSVFAAACSSSGGSDGGTDAGHKDSGMAPSICGNPGDPGNAIGVGKYCQTIDDCSANSKATICSTIGNPGAYFCTAQCDPCTSPADFCGVGAACSCETLGCGCTPIACIARLVDGGQPSVCDGGVRTDAGAGTAYQAVLNGSNEVPAVNTTHTGTASFTLSTDGMTFTYSVQSNVQIATAAHIHKGAVGTSGNPIFTLMGSNGTYSGSQPVSAADVADLQAGNWYVNIHSMAFPNGEIRGQVVPGTH